MINFKCINLARSILTLTVSAFMAMACGSAGNPDSESKIYGGTRVASGTWSNTIALTDSRGGVFCSGTAITPTIVITAAHCAPAMADTNRIAVYVGDGRSGGAFLGQYKITKVRSNPLYATSADRSYDVAYVVLAQALPLPASAYVPVLTDKAEIAELIRVGATARIMGFGERENGDIGLKYQVDAPIRGMSTNEVSIGGSGKDSCQGDSGGPAFAQLKNGEWRMFGVVSRGGQCGTGGIYGMIYKNICWVEKDSGVGLGLKAGSCP